MCCKKIITHPKPKDPSQHKKIFHSQCNVNNKVSALIIDDGSYDNIVSKLLVRQLKLQAETHPTPYKLGWIKEGSIVTVANICRVPLLIGKSYKEEVICEVVDMDALEDYGSMM
ncbi:unnamed protein product [Musa textilis]